MLTGNIQPLQLCAYVEKTLVYFIFMGLNPSLMYL